MSATKLLVTSSIALLFACQSTPETATMAVDVEPTVSEEVIHAGIPVTKADLSISGMSCEMMCGGAIKKALAGLSGVKGSEIVFSEDTEEDHAIVTYDANAVTEAQLVQAVSAIHDGQYKVVAVHITTQKLVASPALEKADGPAEPKVSASLPQVLVPSLLELLSQVLRP